MSKKQNETLNDATKIIEEESSEIKEQSSLLIQTTEIIKEEKEEIIKQNNLLNETAKIINEEKEEIKKQKDILNEATQIIRESNQNIKKVKDAQSTQIIDDFPDNINSIITEINYFKNNNVNNNHATVKKELLICTDVVGYGVLSNNSAHTEYINTLKDIVDKRSTNNIDVTWHYYDEKTQISQSSEQFAAYIPSVGETEEIKTQKMKALKDYLFRTKRKVKLSCPICTFDLDGKCEKAEKKPDCFLIKSLKEDEPDALSGFLNRLERTQKENLRSIKLINIGELNNKLPFFAWFFIKYESEKPIIENAIISYPAYIQGSTEKCFKTSDDSLTNMFYSIIKDFVNANSKKIESEEKNLS